MAWDEELAMDKVLDQYRMKELTFEDAVLESARCIVSAIARHGNTTENNLYDVETAVKSVLSAVEEQS